MNESGTGATFRRRTNLIQLITTVLGTGIVGFLVANEPTNPFLAMSAIGIAVVVQVVVIIALTIANAIVSPQEPDDERDSFIAHRSTRFSWYVLTIGVGLSMCAITAQQMVTVASKGEATSLLVHPMMAAYLLLGCLVVSEIVRFVTIALDYRTR